MSDNIVGQDQEILDLILHALEKEKARSMHQAGNRIEFRGGIFRLVMNWNQLVSISSGEIEVFSTGKIVTLAYHIRFTEMLILVSAGVIGFLCPAVWRAPNLNVLEASAMLAFAWLWLFGGNVAITYYRFPKFLRRALESITS